MTFEVDQEPCSSRLSSLLKILHQEIYCAGRRSGSCFRRLNRNEVLRKGALPHIRRQSASPATCGYLRVEIIGDFQPVFHFVVNVLKRSDRDAMGDAVLFCEAAGVYQLPFRFHVSQSETYVNSGLRGGFDLSEDMVAIQGNDGLARTRLSVFTGFETGFQKRVIDWTEAGLST